MAGTTKQARAIATIDCELITVKKKGEENEYALDTASQISVEPSIETTDAVKLIIKGILRAQKPEQSTLTGNTITLTDNVFTPELVLLLQGGTLTPDTDGATLKSYEPPKVGEKVTLTPFELCAYSAIYNAAGTITGYEKITYPNCHGVPVAFGAEDGTFRVNTYTINSMPDTGEAPYKLEYVTALPTVS